MKHLFKKQIFVFGALAALVFVLSCNKYKKAVVKEQYLDDEIPVYYAGNQPDQDARLHLGRVLFYDKNLSVNNSISCASCHKQAFAFADNVALSTGFENRLTKRNSIAIQNLISVGIIEPTEGSPALFWDGREKTLNSLISKPIANHIEMGMDNEDALLEKINALPYIQELLKKAYPGEKLDMNKLSFCMSEFLTLINTSNSKFDKAMFMNVPQAHLNALESKGQQLFQTTYQCNSCHNPSPGMYMSSGFVNIGLDVNSPDKGRMNITNNSMDDGRFKVPDLHNVSITAPYMHDGRFQTLDEVLEHYSHGIQSSDKLDFRLRNQDGSPKKLNITEEDKTALIAFLNTMTDYTMLTNPLFSNPFKYK